MTKIFFFNLSIWPFQLDLQLKSSDGGDISTYVTNGEWALIGRNLHLLRCWPWRRDCLCSVCICHLMSSSIPTHYHIWFMIPSHTMFQHLNGLTLIKISLNIFFLGCIPTRSCTQSLWEWIKRFGKDRKKNDWGQWCLLKEVLNFFAPFSF